MAHEKIYRIATAQAKKLGYSKFNRGSKGYKKREQIVMALKKKRH